MPNVTVKVTSQAMAILESIPYRNPAPELTIVPAIPEVTKCVVLTGSPVKPEMPIKAAETNSADAPCAGVDISEPLAQCCHDSSIANHCSDSQAKRT
jgi:hypothetical protein